MESFPQFSPEQKPEKSFENALQEERKKNPETPVLDVLQMTSSEMQNLPEAKRHEVIAETYEAIKTALEHKGAREYENVSEMYKILEGLDVVVRREDPERLVSSVLEEEALGIYFDGDEPYSNAVRWREEFGSEGIRNAYLEGHGAYNGVVTIAGFREGNLKIHEVVDEEQQAAGLSRDHVYSVEGDVRPEDLLFVATRTPASGFREEDMTDDELERYEVYRERLERGQATHQGFIHRGFLFADNLKKE